jgi:hypothetical protein
MEVLGSRKYQCFVLWDTFDLVSPLPRNLDRCLDCFRSSVHRQSHIISKHGLDLLRPLREDIVVEGA